MYPEDLGFFMPPEWARHRRTFMEWPVKEALWPEPYHEVLEAFAEVAVKIAEFEPVTLLARPELAEQAKKYCGRAVEIMEMEHDDSWMRDNGPTFVVTREGDLAGINWRFNAWGGKYPFEKDDLVAGKLLDRLGIRRFDVPLVLEGGSIHVDGEGTLLTTEECLLHPNRNPHLSRADIEEELKRHLNIRKILWLKKGLYGDDTDGHIDNVACFAGPGVVLLQAASDPKNPNYERSRENLEVLQKAVDAKGRRLKVITIEQPEEASYGGVPLTLSYMNFYFVNGGILLPVFGGRHSDTDGNAEAVLKAAFPGRRIVKVNGMPIIRGGGNVHCITQQMPAV